MREQLFHPCALIWILTLFSSPLGCGGDGGRDANDATPPANVAGIWVTAPINMQEATLIQCTGDLEVFNGMTVAELFALGVECTYDSDPVVTQSGTTFNVVRVNFSCVDGNYGYIDGGGSVSGNSVSYQINTISQYYDNRATDYFSGHMTGPDSLTVSESRFTISGRRQGECRVSPPYSIAVTIIRAGATYSSAQTQESIVSRMALSNAMSAW